MHHKISCPEIVRLLYPFRVDCGLIDMVKYDPKEDESLWPENGYAVIEMDEFKHPSNDDHMVMLGQFDAAEDVVIPVAKPGYTYYVHSSEMEGWARDQWKEEFGD